MGRLGVPVAVATWLGVTRAGVRATYRAAEGLGPAFALSDVRPVKEMGEADAWTGR